MEIRAKRIIMAGTAKNTNPINSKNRKRICTSGFLNLMCYYTSAAVKLIVAFSNFEIGQVSLASAATF